MSGKGLLTGDRVTITGLTMLDQNWWVTWTG